MDQQKLQKFQNCSKHSKKKLKFIQVNQVRDKPTSNLFYCTDCINEDLDFKGINYLLIEQIILQGENCILQKWPPVNDQQIVEKLIKETSKFDQSQYVVQRITNYFAELRDEVNRKIEYCQKQMINRALDLPLGKDQIIKQYQQISQIQQLRSLIIESKNNQLDSSVEQKFKNFISELELKKDQNTEQLQKLLEKSTQQQQLVNYEYPNMIKQQIFSFVDKINFFDNDLINNTNNSNRDQPQKVYFICDKLMPLISNKSNYCSDEFLNFVRSQLEKLDSFFEKFCNKNMFQSGKEPIKFDQINDQKMNKINEYVNHQIQLQNDQNYLFQIQQSPFLQDVEKIIKSQINFINLDSQQILSEYFKQTYPFVKDNLNIQQFQQKDNFQLLNSMNEETINNLLLLLKEKQLIENNQKQSETFRIKDNQLFVKYKSYELERILKEFPIFDIIPKNKIDILKDLQLIKSELNDGDKRVFIKYQIDQNQIQIGADEENYYGEKKGKDSNCISNIALQQNKKYVFRIQLKSFQNQKLIFGLMQLKNFNIQLGEHDQIYACLKTENQKLKLGSLKLKYKYLKGENMVLEQGSIVECRIWLGGQIFQILDYPKYEYQVTIENEKLSQLSIIDDFKFFLQAGHSSMFYSITDAFIVEDFNN